MEESTKLVDESTEALWYVVHTYSGYENKVANDLQTMVENRHLQDLICDIKVPWLVMVVLMVTATSRFPSRWFLRSTRTASRRWWSTSCSPATFWSKW